MRPICRVCSHTICCHRIDPSRLIRSSLVRLLEIDLRAIRAVPSSSSLIRYGAVRRLGVVISSAAFSTSPRLAVLRPAHSIRETGR